MARTKVFVRGIVIVVLVAGAGGAASAVGWGVANAAFAMGRYVGAH